VSFSPIARSGFRNRIAMLVAMRGVPLHQCRGLHGALRQCGQNELSSCRSFPCLLTRSFISIRDDLSQSPPSLSIPILGADTLSGETGSIMSCGTLAGAVIPELREGCTSQNRDTSEKL